MSSNTNINTFLQKVKDSPIFWALSILWVIIVAIITLLYTIRATGATERTEKATESTHQNEANEKSENKNPYATFSGNVTVSPDSNWISILVHNVWNETLYFDWNYPVIIKIESEVWSWKTINWTYPSKINQWETVLIHGLFYGNWIEQQWKLRLRCEFRNWIIDSQSKTIPCEVYWDSVEQKFSIPSLKDKKIIWIDASDSSDKIDFELIKKDISNSFIWTTSPWKIKWTWKITITNRCSGGKRIFLFYNERIVDEESKNLMKEILYKYYSRVSAIDNIEEIIEFTFVDLSNPNSGSCEAQILDLISDCAKTIDWNKKNICAEEQDNFIDALLVYQTDYVQKYYTKNLISEDVSFVFIIFANN